MSSVLQLFAFLFMLSNRWSVHSFMIPNICLSFPALKAGVNKVLLRFHWWPFSKNNPRLFLGAKGKGLTQREKKMQLETILFITFFSLSIILFFNSFLSTFLDWKFSKSLTKTSFSKSGSLTERTGVYPSKYLRIKEKKSCESQTYLSSTKVHFMNSYF